MKLISSVLVLFVGAIVMIAGSYRGGDNPLFYLGAGLGLIGLIAWYREMARP